MNTKAQRIKFLESKLNAGQKHPRYLNRYEELTGKKWGGEEKKVILSEAVQKLIDANPQLNVADIKATGKNGNIIVKDVKAALKSIKEN